MPSIRTTKGNRFSGGFVDITLLGDKDLSNKFKKLELAVQKKITRKALRPAARLFAKAAKALVPEDTGALKQSIKVRAIKRNSQGLIGVQAITGQGFFTGPTYYGGFLEFGTKRIPAFEFMRGAFEENQQAGRKIVLTKMRQLVAEAMR